MALTLFRSPQNICSRTRVLGELEQVIMGDLDTVLELIEDSGGAVIVYDGRVSASSTPVRGR